MTTILAVDDSATMRKCLEITFAGTEFELLAVDSAQAALEKVKTVQPALVIADVSLPPNDGYELCSTIKLASPNLPVLMLSSKQNPFDPAKGAQADGHIDKPFDTQVLQDRARSMVSADEKPADTDVPAAFAGESRAKPVAERGPASGKIPAPRRKRPTPAMMSNPLTPEPPAAAEAAKQANISSTAAQRNAEMRRTVPFAMPGASKRPAKGPDRTMPMGRAEQAASAALGRGAPGRRSEPRKDTKLSSQAKSIGDTLPGVPTGDGAPATPQQSTLQQATPQQATLQQASQPAAQPVPQQAAPPQQVAQAPPTGPVAQLPDRAAADLETRLGDLGLTKDQMDGVLALSRELIEQVVWEVVPVLAETLIKEEIQRLTKEG